MTTNNNRHHIHHHEHLDEAEIYKRKNLSAAQRRKKLGATDKPCGEGVRMLTQNCC